MAKIKRYGSFANSKRAKLGLTSKAGKRADAYQRPPEATVRPGIIKRTESWIEDHKRKAFTPNITESIESLVPGAKPIKLQVIPGIPRYDLQRATRRTGLGRRGTPITLEREPAGWNDKLCYDRV